jgi:hypothetical protein
MEEINEAPLPRISPDSAKLEIGQNSQSFIAGSGNQAE